MVRCADVRGNLKAYADGELGRLLRWRVRRHIDACPECGAELEGLQRLSAALLRTDTAAPSRDLRARILDALPPPQTIEAPRPAWRRAPVMALSGAAGAAFLAGLLWHAMTPTAEPRGGPSTAASTSGAAARMRIARAPEGPPVMPSSGSPIPDVQAGTTPAKSSSLAEHAAPTPSRMVEPKMAPARPLEARTAQPEIANDSAVAVGPSLPEGTRSRATIGFSGGFGGIGGGSYGRGGGGQGNAGAGPPTASGPAPGAAGSNATGTRYVRLNVDEIEAARKRVVALAQARGGQENPLMGKGAAGSVSLLVPADRVDALIAELQAGAASRQQVIAANSRMSRVLVAASKNGQNAQNTGNVAGRGNQRKAASRQKQQLPSANAVMNQAGQQNARNIGGPQNRDTGADSSNGYRLQKDDAGPRENASAHTLKAAGAQSIQPRQARTNDQMVLVIVELAEPAAKPAAAQRSR